MKRRLLSFVLTMCLLITILPVHTFAYTQGEDGMGPVVITGGKRDFKWPVPGYYNLQSCFYDQRNHCAIDIAAPVNTPAVASYSGTVLKAVDGGTSYFGDGFGNYVVLQHSYALPSGIITLYTRYSHLNSVSVTEGTTVQAGTEIGKIGTTGSSQGYHLDFQILYGNWQPYQTYSIDPYANQLLELPGNLVVYDSWPCGQSYLALVKELYATPIYETAWFPAHQLNVTQLAYESYSHGSQNAIDIAPGGSVFAPFTGTIVYTDSRWGYVVFQSADKVYYADGTLDYMTVAFMHDEDISDLYNGQVIKQGVAFYQAGGMGSGNPNAYADHVHLSVHKGHASGITSAGKYGAGDVFAYNAFCVSETTNIYNQGVMNPNNYMTNGAPSNWNGLWRKIRDTRPGKPVLHYTINENKVTFTWDATANTTHYNLWINTKNSAGEWEYVEQIFYAESGVSRELEEGEYLVELLSYNSNAYEADGSDWVHTNAEDVFFTIEKRVSNYEVISLPNKLQYWLGEELNLNGFALRVNYSDGSTEMITEGFSASGFDSDTIGIKNVAISYGEINVILELEVVPGGMCGDNVRWYLDAQGTLTIYGTGNMYDYSWGETPWYEYSSSVKDVILQDGVTGIGDTAFANCENLTDIIVSDSVTSIGRYAFNNCTGLTSVSIGDNVKSIGMWAFGGCSRLASVSIGDNVTSIDAYAFFGCNLTYIIIPDSVTFIGYGVFFDCSNLNAIWVDPANLEYTSDAQGVLFNKAMTQLIQAPCTLTGSYFIPDSVKAIDQCAFDNCRSLTDITISDNTTVIGDSAFLNCSNLTSISIPNSVTSIGIYAFYGCAALKDVYYEGTQNQWNAISINNTNNGNECLYAATLHCAPSLQPQENGTLLLVEDWTTEELTISTKQVLDLNGHTLTVESLASFGQIIDSVGGGGLIVENLALVDNDWLPILDSTGCYRFYEYEVSSLGSKENAAGATFGFTLDFVDSSAYNTLLESQDVSVQVTLGWGDNSKSVAFSKELIQKYVALQSKYPQLRPYMKLNVTGVDSLADGTVLTVTPAITAVDGKIHKTGEGMQYIA